MEILVGFVLCLVVEAFLWGAWRAWRNWLPPVPVQPHRTAAQRANERVFEELRANTPLVVSMRLQRRTRRGRRVFTNVQVDEEPE